jgi:ABC-type sulfate transport system permease component
MKVQSCACRWVVLAQKPFKDQIRVPEFYALGIFFALNVLALQLYLGTARIQLEELSSEYELYVQTLSFTVSGEHSNSCDVNS